MIVISWQLLQFIKTQDNEISYISNFINSDRKQPLNKENILNIHRINFHLFFKHSTSLNLIWSRMLTAQLNKCLVFSLNVLTKG